MSRNQHLLSLNKLSFDDVKICTANSAGKHLEESLAFPRNRHGDLFDRKRRGVLAQGGGFSQNGGAHRHMPIGLVFMTLAFNAQD